MKHVVAMPSSVCPVMLQIKKPKLAMKLNSWTAEERLKDNVCLRHTVLMEALVACGYESFDLVRGRYV